MTGILTSADLISGYALDMTRRNLSRKSIGVFRKALENFAQVAELPEATAEDIHAWLETGPHRTALSARSKSWYISALHGFYEWAIAAGHLSTDPTHGIRRPKVSRRLPRPLPAEELAGALELADGPMRAMLLLGALAGLRSMEIAGLRAEDVSLARRTMRVVGKGDKERVLPVHPEVACALESLPLPERGAIFRAESGRPMTADRVSHVVSRFLHDTGSESGTHALRHYFGTSVYQSTLDLRLTQELMGHSSPATTAGYAAVSMSKAAAAVAALKIGDR
jgi:integrase/recombinase XerC